jgi:hypothetical protein
VAPAPILVVTGPAAVGKSTVSGLVAAAFERGVHVRIDDFTRFVVSGWVDPWLPEAAHQNRVLGGAVVAAALEFARGGYTVVVDGTIFPDAMDELAPAMGRAETPLNYAVLRCDLRTCSERAIGRNPNTAPDSALAADLYAKFEDLGEYERHVVDATGPADLVAAAVLTAFHSGSLATA